MLGNEGIAMTQTLKIEGSEAAAAAESNVLPERITIPVTGMTCSACQSFVQRTLASQAGVKDAAVDVPNECRCDSLVPLRACGVHSGLGGASFLYEGLVCSFAQDGRYEHAGGARHRGCFPLLCGGHDCTWVLRRAWHRP